MIKRLRRHLSGNMWQRDRQFQLRRTSAFAKIREVGRTREGSMYKGSVEQIYVKRSRPSASLAAPGQPSDVWESTQTGWREMTKEGIKHRPFHTVKIPTHSQRILTHSAACASNRSLVFVLAHVRSSRAPFCVCIFLLLSLVLYSIRS